MLLVAFGRYRVGVRKLQILDSTRRIEFDAAISDTIVRETDFADRIAAAVGPFEHNLELEPEEKVVEAEA